MTGPPPPRRHTQTNIRDLLTDRQLRPRASLGQCFLIDLNLLEILVDRAKLDRDDFVLEVGAGTGSLTQRLAALAGVVVSVEIDQGLYELARETTRAYPNVTLLHADILRNKNTLQPAVLDAVRERSTPLARRKLVANLPFAVATPLLTLLLVSDLAWDRFVVTVQKEVAERILAAPGVKDYGSVSVLVRALADAELVRELPPSAFWPRPKVASTIIEIVPRPEKRARIRHVTLLQRFVRGVMLHRRKNLRSSIHALLPDLDKGGIDPYLARVGIDPRGRAEDLPADEFIRLVNELPAEWLGSFPP